MFAQDEYAMNQKNFYGFEVRMTNNNFDEVGSKFSQNRHTLIYIIRKLIQLNDNQVTDTFKVGTTK